MAETTVGLGFLSAFSTDGEQVLFDESLHLGLGHFPAESVFLDVAGEVRPPQPQLLVVAMVHFLKHLDGPLGG